jgi:hypothetical protein
MASRKKLSPNAQRRASARRLDKLAKDRARLAALEPGGAPDRPIEVPSASLVEPKARSLRCVRCEEPYQVAHHAAATVAHRRLRVVTVTCARCGSGRAVYFQIAPPLLN